MGLYQDQTDSLSELKRLAVLVMDDARRMEIGEDQWPLAIIAYGLVTCNDESSLPQALNIYETFSLHCADDTRNRCILQLAGFIGQRRGNGWRALLPFALSDQTPAIRRHAAFMIGTLAVPRENAPFAGFEELARIIRSTPLPGQRDNSPLLDALLGTADLRLLPTAFSISENCSENGLKHLLEHSEMQPNALSCEWLLSVLETYPGLSDSIAETLISAAPRAGEIVDVILPIPSWLFKNASPQPLHGWTRPEYFARMRQRLEAVLEDNQLQRVQQAWID